MANHFAIIFLRTAGRLGRWFLTNEKNIPMATRAFDHGWREILESTRRYNRSVRGEFDLRLYWRGRTFRENPGVGEFLSGALAFAAIMDHIPLHCYPGEVLTGSRAGFCVTVLPETISRSDYRSAVEANTLRGGRDFWAGWDHTLADYPTLLVEGISGLLGRIRNSREIIDNSEGDRILESMAVSVEAFSRFVHRHALLAPSP